MKNIFSKAMQSIILLFIVLAVIACVSVPKVDGGEEIIAEGEPTKFEGKWIGTMKNHQTGGMQNVEYTFHFNTWEISTDANELGIILPAVNGTFTYNEKTLTTKIINVSIEGMDTSLEGFMNQLPKNIQKKIKKELGIEDFSITKHTYQLTGDTLVIIAPAMVAPSYGINIPEEVTNLTRKIELPEEQPAEEEELNIIP